MDFQIWKVNVGKGEDAPRYTFSLREMGTDTPVIFEQAKFSRLFPEINHPRIPEAPAIGILQIEATLK
jgi:hypothetical protein